MLYLYCSSVNELTYILDESVFALSFLENLAVETRITTAPVICICLRVFDTLMMRVWDCFRLFVFRFTKIF